MSAYLSLSPWALEGMTVEEVAELHVRAALLDAHVSAVHSRGGWTVHATQGNVTASTYHAKGRLAVAIGAVLSRFEDERRRLAGMETGRYSADELVTLQDQSA